MKNMFDGFRMLAMGMVIAVEVPVVMVKTAIGNAVNKQKKVEAKESVKVDISNCEKDAQDWMRRLYNKKNGIV